jgi:hypothetical protein
VTRDDEKKVLGIPKTDPLRDLMLEWEEGRPPTTQEGLARGFLAQQVIKSFIALCDRTLVYGDGPLTYGDALTVRARIADALGVDLNGFVPQPVKWEDG